MPYVVTEPCINCKYTDCVPVCPVEAIYPDDELPEECEHYIQWNEHLANQWLEMGYNITETKEPAPLEGDCEEQEKSEDDILTWDV